MTVPGSGDVNPYSQRPWSWRPYTKKGMWKRGFEQLEFDPGWEAAYFVEMVLRHIHGQWRGKPFILTPTELAVILSVFGTVNDERLRIIRKAWIEWARKNGKSEVAAAVALKLLFMDGEHGAEIYGAAHDKDQAGIVFKVAASMVEMSPYLSKRCKLWRPQKRIVIGDSFYVAIPADAAGSHGFNAHGVIFDEVHTQRSRELWDVLETSTGAREQPLIFAITTAGTDRETIAWELHEYALAVQEGTVKDPTWYTDIRNTPPNADWRDRRNWHYANPHLGDRKARARGTAFRNIEELEQLAREAEHRPRAQTTFRNLYLNQWTSSVEQWIEMDRWDQGATPPLSLADLAGRQVWIGVDLSSTRDITAVCYLFDYGDKRLGALWRFYLPEAWTHVRPHHVLTAHAAAGYITLTPGDVIDYETIERDVVADAETFLPQELGYDPWQATMLVQRWQDQHGFRCVPVRQGSATLTAPTKELERIVMESMLLHGGNPVARYMADGVKALTQGDQMRLDKKNSLVKIDGITALVNALERKMATSSYIEPRATLL